jgi:hypothetical protein
MRNTWWSYVLVKTYEYSIVTWIHVTLSRVFIFIVLKYEYIYVITSVEVEHDRNKLITGH